MNNSTQTQSRRPSVFVSYADESSGHQDAVAKLVARLESEHIAVISDHAHLDSPPREGWQRWTERQVAEARVVLVICSPSLKLLFDGQSPLSETVRRTYMTQALFEQAEGTTQFYPVLPDDGQFDDVPATLTPWHRDFRFPSGMGRVLKLVTHALRNDGGQAVAGQACSIAIRDTPTLDPTIRSVPPPAPTRLTWRWGAGVLGALALFALAMSQGSREARAKRMFAEADVALATGDLGAATRQIKVAMGLSLMKNHGERDLALIDAYEQYLDGADASALLSHIETSLRTDANQPHAYTIRGHVHAARGEWEDASRSYKRALGLQPKHLEAQLGLGRLAFRQGDLQGLAETLQEAKQWIPSHPQVLTLEGQLNLQQGHIKAAHKSFEQALRRDPSFLPPAMGLAATLRRKGEFERALATMSTVEGEVNTGASRGFNRAIWTYRLTPTAQASRPAHPAVELRGSAPKHYLYELNLALTACLAKDADRFADAQEQLARLKAAPGMQPHDAQAGELLTWADIVEGQTVAQAAGNQGRADANQQCMQRLGLSYMH